LVEGDKKDEKVDKDRRNFLKTTVVASAIIAAAGAAAVVQSINATEGSTATSFPSILVVDANTGQVANVNTLTDNVPLLFYYPLEQVEPNILVKLGQPAENGIGPDGDIIAFSDVCQHLGCNPGFVATGGSPPCNSGYVASGPIMYCCCHGSKYDLLKNAAVIQPSPAPRPVPRVILDVDSSGNIYATGMGPPTIFGHGTPGSSDVTADLQGGVLDSTSSTSTSQGSS
jgi:arsenite oxidase small subunit